jgi:transcriptional regulator with XRE-family HTH domain
MGRKAGISESEKRLRVAFARALSIAIGNRRGAQSRAARQLGTSRQAISLYIRHKATPGPEILRRACTELNLALELGGFRLDAGGFPKAQKALPVPEQTSIFDAISEVANEQLNVKVLRKGAHSIDLKVSIDFKRVSTVR